MKLSAMPIILACGLLAIAFTFWQAHRRADIQFNALDLVLENGRVSRIAVAFMLVLCVTTWVVVNREIEGTLTAEFFIAYGAMWVAPLVARVVFNKQDMPALPAKEP